MGLTEMANVKTRTKLTRIGNSTGITLSRDVLRAAGLSRGDDVIVEADGEHVIIAKAKGDRAKVQEIGQRFMARYSRTLAALAK